MANLFNSVKMTRPSKNVFDLTHDVKLSMNMGELVPIMCTECIPGDKFSIGAEALVRMSPLISPVMHRMDVYIHYFFVPNRLLWSNWENFITNTPDPMTSLPPAFPYNNVATASYTMLHDYLGIPTPLAAQTEKISALPMAAYQKIYNDFYRDQNLVDPIDTDLVDGDNSSNTELRVLRKRAWQHDYFTAALPWAQKGPAVEIPILDGNVILSDPDTWTTPPGFQRFAAPTVSDSGTVENDATIPGEAQMGVDDGTTYRPAVYDPRGTLQVDGEATTINDLRRATKLQEWLEKAARGGSRYVENIFAFFGVRSQDSRLQRPEYITGTKSPIQISEVLNTAGNVDRPQGDMAGHGISVTNGGGGGYYCQEHGYIIGIMSVLPKTAYQQGIPKHFLKFTDPFQFYWPQFAHIGEQELLKKEVYAFQGTNGNQTFGYVPRYAEYKFEQNRVAGDFRTTLDHWHLGRIFSAPPLLNQEFIECVPTDRVFAVQEEDSQKLLCHVLNKIRAVRPMPKFGTPTF